MTDPSPHIRRFVRQTDAATPSTDFAAAVYDALRADLVVELYDEDPVGPYQMAFRLRLQGGAVRVERARGVHLGTFADVAAAIAHGWGLFGMAREAAGR